MFLLVIPHYHGRIHNTTNLRNGELVLAPVWGIVHHNSQEYEAAGPNVSAVRKLRGSRCSFYTVQVPSWRNGTAYIYSESPHLK